MRASNPIQEDEDSPGLRDWMAPGAALICSLIVAMLGPHYRTWFGDGMPAFSRHFLALYPLWIFLGAIAVAARAFAATIDGRHRWKLFDAALGIASMLVVAAAIIALALPVFTRASAM